ncbi:MAG: hypothetical protein ACF8SC_11970 [Phycisphaerales bacterium JB037]
MAHDKEIRIMCPRLTCRKLLSVPESARGKTVRCRYCRTSIRIPEAKSAGRPESSAAG